MIELIDPDREMKVGESDEFLGFSTSKDRSNIIVCAQTWGGKTTFLQNMLFKSLLNSILPENLIIFSATAKQDLSYRPLILWLDDNTTGQIKIFEEIDMKMINAIFKK